MFADVKTLPPLLCLVVVLGACSPPPPVPGDEEGGPETPVTEGPPGDTGPGPGGDKPCAAASVEGLLPVLTRPAAGEWGVPGALVLQASGVEEVTRAFERAGLDARVRALREQISPLVREDPRKETSTAGYERAVEETLTFIRERPAVVRSQGRAQGVGASVGVGSGAGSGSGPGPGVEAGSL